MSETKNEYDNIKMTEGDKKGRKTTREEGRQRLKDRTQQRRKEGNTAAKKKVRTSSSINGQACRVL